MLGRQFGCAPPSPEPSVSQARPCHVVVASHRDTPFFQHQTTPPIKEIERNAISAGHGGYALAVVQRLFNAPDLLGSRPTAATTIVGDDFNLRCKHALRVIPRPPGSSPVVRTKRGPVHDNGTLIKRIMRLSGLSCGLVRKFMQVESEDMFRIHKNSPTRWLTPMERAWTGSCLNGAERWRRRPAYGF